MIKVLLIDAGSNREELNEPYGIASLAGNLEAVLENITVDLAWLLLNPINLEILHEYDVIGISAKLGSLSKVENLLSNLETKRKSHRVIVGGPLSTFGYQELLKKYDDIICVRGEGETSLLKFCQAIYYNGLSDNNLQDIPNLAYIKNGNVIETERICENLEKLAKPNRFFVKELCAKGGIVRIEGSRGCAYSDCSFCSIREHYAYHGWRPFPIEFIIDQLIILSELGCKSPYFTDEDFFGGDFNRSKELAIRIIEEKEKNRINPEMNFFFDARINDVLHKKGYETLQLWKKAGLRELFIGLESGVQKQLRRYGKPASPNKNAKAIQVVKDLGIQLDTGYILFDPEMSFDELIENVRYIELINLSKLDSRSLKTMRAQPFTELTKRYFANDFIIGSLNIDLLFYPLKYTDEKVFNVLRLYNEWESDLMKDIYAIQAKSRGEVSSESYRENLKVQLSKLREMDFFALKVIIDKVRGKLSEIEMYNILSEKKSEKKSLITDML